MFHHKLWDSWKKLGRILGKIQTTLILSIIYYLVITPIGLIKRLFVPKKKVNSYWIDIPKQNHNLDESYKQY